MRAASAVSWAASLFSACVLGGCVTSSAARLEPVRWAAATATPATAPLSIMIWNIGYAGLGEESDFIADGGARLRPPSRAVVEKNLAGVAEQLRSRQADIILMQEVAGPGLLTRNVDVRAGVRAALPGYRMTYSADVASRLHPGGIALDHGPATLLRVEAAETHLVDLPDEPHAFAGLVPRNYHAQVTDLFVDGRPWTVVNLHLAAFDDGDTRRRQVEAVLAIGAAKFAEGRAVVIGGDWNHALAEVRFPYTDRRRPVDWLRDFPRDLMPTGWSIVADLASPTVRTNDRPYVPGANFTTIIDGFVISPNVRAVSVEALDTGFRHTDHQPVVARFERID